MELGGINIGKLFGGGVSQAKNIFSVFFWSIMIVIVIGIIAYIIYGWYKNKTFYTTPVSLTILMENGIEKTRYDLRGGIFWNRGIKDFKIKIPKQRKPHILGYIPDLSKSTSADGRIGFITSGDRTIWQQYETKWILKKKEKIGEEEFEYDLVKTPIPREIKQIAVNSIKNWRDTVDKTKLTAFGIAIGAFIIMVIAHLISLFIQTKIKCGISG